MILGTRRKTHKQLSRADVIIHLSLDLEEHKINDKRKDTHRERE
jgi:hypothetical protein